jgi:DNA-binding transcriptional regulator YdaS (Cro superfamily)
MATLKQYLRRKGAAGELAAILGVSRPLIYYWRRARVPSEWVIPLETATRGAVSRHEARPDIYPRESKR